MLSCSVMSYFLWPKSSPPGSSVHGDFTGKNTGVGCLALLQEIFPTQVSHLAGGFFITWATREAQVSLLQLLEQKYFPLLWHYFANKGLSSQGRREDLFFFFISVRSQKLTFRQQSMWSSLSLADTFSSTPESHRSPLGETFNRLVNTGMDTKRREIIVPGDLQEQLIILEGQSYI